MLTTDESDLFEQRVLSFITGEELVNAIGSITLYLTPGAYTGAHFERLVSSDPYVIDADDLVAVTMLGVSVPASASIRILGAERTGISRLLRMIPPHMTISDPDSKQLLSKSGPVWDLWDVLKPLHGLGRTITSKLLAAKRPALVPIFDTHVSSALRLDKVNDWKLWGNFMRSPASREAIANLRGNISAETVVGLSDLRLLDIAIWMRTHGATAVSKLEGRHKGDSALVRYQPGLPAGHPDGKATT